MGTALLFFPACRTMHRSTKSRAVSTAVALRGAVLPSGGREMDVRASASAWTAASGAPGQTRGSLGTHDREATI
jgi:hypothetical protein